MGLQAALSWPQTTMQKDSTKLGDAMKLVNFCFYKHKSLVRAKVILCLFMVLNIFCKKDVPSTSKIEVDDPNIKVADIILGTPIPNATVGLFKDGGDILNPTNILVDVIFTDSNGYFKFPPNLEVDEVQVGKDGYASSELLLIEECKTDHLIKIIPNSYVNYHVKNVNKKYLFIDLGIMIQGDFVSLGGYDVDTTFKNIMCPATVTEFGYWLRNQDLNDKKHVYMPMHPIPLDTIDVNVEY